MAYEYDRFEREDGGGSFLMGLLAGTVLGAGLGMLFAPKAGSELRTQLTEQAGKLRSTAADGYQQASGKVTQIVDRGREAYDRARSSATLGRAKARPGACRVRQIRLAAAAPTCRAPALLAAPRAIVYSAASGRLRKRRACNRRCGVHGTPHRLLRGHAAGTSMTHSTSEKLADVALGVAVTSAPHSTS